MYGHFGTSKFFSMVQQHKQDQGNDDPWTGDDMYNSIDE